MRERLSFISSFIFRPVTAWVLNILVVIVGLVGLRQLSTRLYPIIDNPTINVTTNFANAGASVIETQITKPMEEQLMGVTGLKDISSSSTSSSSSISLTFLPSVDMNEVYSQVQSRVNRARAHINTGRVKLEESIIAKADPNSSPIAYLLVSGKNFSPVEIGDSVIRLVKPELESINGIASLDVWGGGAGSSGSAYKMHIHVNPDKLNAFNLTLSELLENIKGQLFKAPFGPVDDGRFDRNVSLQSELNSIQAVKDGISIYTDSKVIPLVQVIDEIKILDDDPNRKFRFTKRDTRGEFTTSQAVGIGVKAQARQSPVLIDQGLQEKLPLIKQTLPQGMDVSVIENTADIIKNSVRSVYRALFEAILLVFAVILLFLQSGRASLVPMITIPICLCSGFATMYFAGYTINLLTLLAMVLATGLVVDDAIVVLENTYKYIEKGETKVKAAIKGITEIQFSVIAMTLTLAAVYAPVALVPGIVGSLFSEFAITLTVMVIVSGFTALILSPMMCSRILEDTHHKQGLAAKIESKIHLVEQHYQRYVTIAVKHARYLFMMVGLLCLLAYSIFQYGLSSTLAPEIDTKQFVITFRVPNGIKMKELDPEVLKLERQLKDIPEVESFYTQIDIMGTTSYIGVYLKKNVKSTKAILAKYENNIINNAPSLFSNMRVQPQNLKISGAANSSSFSLSVQSNKDYNMLIGLGQKIARELTQQKGIVANQVFFDRTTKIPSYNIVPNRDRAALLGVNPYQLQNNLASMSSGLEAGYFTKDSKRSEIYLRVSQDLSAQDVMRFSVRNNKRELVPISEIAEIVPTKIQPAIPRQSGMKSFTIFAEVDPKYGTAYVYNNFKPIINQLTPKGYRVQPTGALADYVAESSNTIYIIALSLVFIYLILAAQFESFIDPVIVMGTVPLSWIGAVTALYLASDGSFNIFSGIGLLTLVGLITKHGILIVDFANRNLENGMSPKDAAIQACTTRFRPIIMTTFAMILGALPLMLSSGIGYEVRRQIGLVIVGGLSMGTVFTLFFIPCLYILIKTHITSKASI